jgi:hypothetical protein
MAFPSYQFTDPKCRAKKTELSQEYMAYKLINSLSGIGRDFSDAQWDEVVTKNPICQKYRIDPYRKFPHYELMSDLVGENHFSGIIIN